MGTIVKRNSDSLYEKPIYDLWNSALFTSIDLTLMGSSGKKLLADEQKCKRQWDVSIQDSRRLPVFEEITRKRSEIEDCEKKNDCSAFDDEGRTLSEVKTLFKFELSDCIKDDNYPEKPKVVPAKKMRQSEIFQLKELEPKQWHHLRCTSEELAADVNSIEDIFSRLMDSRKFVGASERTKALKQLSKILTPEIALKLCVKTHSRRLVMFALDFLRREKTLRSHVRAVMSRMFEAFDMLVELDVKDMVFAKKFHVFQDAISACNMQQVINLANCLLKTSWAGIGSTLGLALIGRLIETANNLNFKAHSAWLEECLPSLAYNVLHVDNIELVYRALGAASAKHLIDNLSMDHEMFRGVC